MYCVARASRRSLQYFVSATTVKAPNDIVRAYCFKRVRVRMSSVIENSCPTESCSVLRAIYAERTSASSETAHDTRNNTARGRRCAFSPRPSWLFRACVETTSVRRVPANIMRSTGVYPSETLLSICRKIIKYFSSKYDLYTLPRVHTYARARARICLHAKLTLVPLEQSVVCDD